MNNIEEKLQEFKNLLLDLDNPVEIEEVLGEVEYLFEDENVSKVLNDLSDDYRRTWSCAEKFYKIKDLVDEEFC